VAAAGGRELAFGLGQALVVLLRGFLGLDLRRASNHATPAAVPYNHAVLEIFSRQRAQVRVQVLP
jgi:hypothetical protein